jgi:hypothetical protein
VRRHGELLSKDPAELLADSKLHMRLDWKPHPDMKGVKANLLRMMGAERVARIEEDQAAELRRLFFLQVLPALILLACRNAVDVEVVPAPDKLNKQRSKKGKPPLVEHRVVRMHLSPARKRAYAASGGSGTAASRGTVVMGHFKVRKSGVYWWQPHARGGRLDGEIKRTFVLTK